MGAGADRGFTQVLSTDLVRDGYAAINTLGDQVAPLLPYVVYVPITINAGSSAATASVDITSLGLSSPPYVIPTGISAANTAVNITSRSASAIGIRAFDTTGANRVANTNINVTLFIIAA